MKAKAPANDQTLLEKLFWQKDVIKRYVHDLINKFQEDRINHHQQEEVKTKRVEGGVLITHEVQYIIRLRSLRKRVKQRKLIRKRNKQDNTQETT